MDAEAQWIRNRECQNLTGREAPVALGGQAGTKRWLKQNLYLRLPLFYGALFYWVHRYFLNWDFWTKRKA